MIRLAGRQWEKGCPGCISEDLMCMELILGRDICWGCSCATSWSDFDLTFNLAPVTMTFIILSRLYL